MIYIDDYQYAFHSFAKLEEDEFPLQQIHRIIPTLRASTSRETRVDRGGIIDMTGLEGNIEVAEAGKEGLDFGEYPLIPLPKQTIRETNGGKKRASDPKI